MPKLRSRSGVSLPPPFPDIPRNLAEAATLQVRIDALHPGYNIGTIKEEGDDPRPIRLPSGCSTRQPPSRIASGGGRLIRSRLRAKGCRRR